jgi:DNA-binding MarR family transcriptional regulator
MVATIFKDDKESEVVGYLTVDLARLIRDEIAHHAEHITGQKFQDAEWRSLLVMMRAPGISEARLGTMCEASPAKMSRILNDMEDKGWVQRSYSGKKDRKSTLLHLTSAGKKMAKQINAGGANMRAIALTGIPPEKRKILMECLFLMQKNLSDHGWAGQA